MQFPLLTTIIGITFYTAKGFESETTVLKGNSDKNYLSVTPDYLNETKEICSPNTVSNSLCEIKKSSRDLSINSGHVTEPQSLIKDILTGNTLTNISSFENHDFNMRENIYIKQVRGNSYKEPKEYADNKSVSTSTAEALHETSKDTHQSAGDQIDTAPDTFDDVLQHKTKDTDTADVALLRMPTYTDRNADYRRVTAAAEPTEKVLLKKTRGSLNTVALQHSNKDANSTANDFHHLAEAHNHITRDTHNTDVLRYINKDANNSAGAPIDVEIATDAVEHIKKGAKIIVDAAHHKTRDADSTADVPHINNGTDAVADALHQTNSNIELTADAVQDKTRYADTADDVLQHKYTGANNAVDATRINTGGNTTADALQHINRGAGTISDALHHINNGADTTADALHNINKGADAIANALHHINRSTNKTADAFHHITRDDDTLYDNDLIMKLTDHSRGLPQSLHVESANGDDPILIFKEPRIDRVSNILKKRESNGSNIHDYNYEDYSEDGQSEMKGTALKTKLSNIGKVFHPKSKHSSTCNPSNHTQGSVGTTVSIESHTESLKRSLQSLRNENMTKIVQGRSSVHKNPEVAESKSGKLVDVKNNGVGWGETKQPGVKPEVARANGNTELEEESKVISVPKRKDNCLRPKGAEPDNCLPSGGLPKIPSISFISKRNESDYTKMLQGDLIDKLVKTVIEKARKNSKMSNELGICPVDIKDIRDQYNKIRTTNKECCKKLGDELECFLNWMLIVDASRKKRSVKGEESLDMNTKVSRKLYDTTASCPGCQSLIKPSPEYQRLYEKVERYKEGNATDPWGFTSCNIPDTTE